MEDSLIQNIKNVNNNFESETTASSSISQSENCNNFSTPFKYDFKNKNDLENFENIIKKNKYVKDDILSVDDVLLYEDLREQKGMIIEKFYPNIYRWAKELERMKKNWRLSKRKNKGSSFTEYIKNAEDKLRNEKIIESQNNNLLSGLMALNINNNNNNNEKEKEKNDKDKNSNKHNNNKKLKTYSMEITVKFNHNMIKNWMEISSNLSIICQAYLPRGTEIKPIKDENDEIYALIQTFSHKEKYDITYIENDIKRNILCVEKVEITNIKEIKEDV